MSKLYHLSNGEAKKCSAQPGKCPFGSDAPHFETKEEAQKFYEASKKDEIMSSLQRKPLFTKDEITPRLDSMMDLDLLNRMIKERDVMESAHPLDDSLRVLCYGQLVQVKGRWNDVTRKTRGLIVQKGQDDYSDAVVVQRPWEKFFTLQQVSSGWSLGDEEDGADNAANSDLSRLDFDAPAEVTDKMDGCFLAETKLNLWGGGTIPIGKVVKEKLEVVLVGQDDEGNFVPTKTTDWHNNGRKDKWVAITVDTPVSDKSGAAGHLNRIKVTYNHEIPLINGNYIPAISIKEGDQLFSHRREIDDNTKHLIESSLLGDGSICSLPNGSSRYQESHSIKQIEYTSFLKEKLGTTGASVRKVISGYGSDMIQVSSKTYDSLKEMKIKWYKNGRKAVPEDLTWIDDFSVAKWLMDDGSMASFKNQAEIIRFSTHSFTREEITRLGDYLSQQYGISYHISNDHGRGLILVINSGRKQQIEKLWEKIAPHVIPSMRYKIPERWRDTPYIDYPTGEEIIVAKPSNVVKVEKLENNKKNFPFGRVGYDITTETHNYMAKGILVHNSLGILYTDPNGDPALSTKGSFTSEQAVYYTKMLRNNEKFLNAAHQLLNKHPDTTFAFELISDGDYQIVLDYDKDDISMLGAIKKSNGLYRSTKDYQNIWTPDNGLTTAESMPAKTLREAFDLPDRKNREGVVVRIMSDDPEKQMQIKIKQEDYKKIHRAFTGFSKKLAREIVRDTPASYGDLLKLAENRDVNVFEKVSETINSVKDNTKNSRKEKEKRTKIYEDAMLNFADEVKKSKDYVDSLSEDLVKRSDAKKEIALTLKNQKGINKSLVFKMFDARVAGKSVDEIDAKSEMRSISQRI